VSFVLLIKIRVVTGLLFEVEKLSAESAALKFYFSNVPF